VAPEHRKQGIGSVLLERLIAAAEWMGRGVALDVGLENDPARHLYERLGFRVTSVRKTSEADRKHVPIEGMARMERRSERATGTTAAT
jgi:ribosomal protein S18 acetylase RimI-like enzyme